MPVTTTATESNFPGAQLSLGAERVGTAFVAYLSDSAKNRVDNSSDPRVPGGRGLLLRIIKYRNGDATNAPVGDIQPGIYNIGATPGPSSEAGTVIEALAMFKDTDAKCLDRISLIAVSGSITVPVIASSVTGVSGRSDLSVSNNLGDLRVDLTFPGGERIVGSFSVNAHGGLAHGSKLSQPNPDCKEGESIE